MYALQCSRNTKQLDLDETGVVGFDLEEENVKKGFWEKKKKKRRKAVTTEHVQVK